MRLPDEDSDEEDSDDDSDDVDDADEDDAADSNYSLEEDEEEEEDELRFRRLPLAFSRMRSMRLSQLLTVSSTRSPPTSRSPCGGQPAVGLR